MREPYPKQLVHFVADHLPDCMSVWATMWDKANQDASLILTRAEIRDDLCSSYTVMVNRLRKLAKSGLLDFFELNDSTIRVELVADSLFGEIGDLF